MHSHAGAWERVKENANNAKHANKRKLDGDQAQGICRFLLTDANYIGAGPLPKSASLQNNNI